MSPIMGQWDNGKRKRQESPGAGQLMFWVNGQQFKGLVNFVTELRLPFISLHSMAFLLDALLSPEGREAPAVSLPSYFYKWN